MEQGATAGPDDRERLERFIRDAVDYRGDVTIVRDGASDPIVGYLFECTGPDGELRILPTDGGDRITIRVDEVREITVSGRDTAAGKTFENWVRRYAEKRLAGEEASLYEESEEG